MNAESPALDLFKALSDECRLRIVRAVSIAELSVAELVRVLGIPQSTVSRHLKPLRESGLLESRRNGTSVFYHRGPACSDPLVSGLLERTLEDLRGGAEDRSSVRRVLDQRTSRSRDFFDNLAGRYGSLTDPGGGWQAMASALAVGFRDQTVVDLGCGEGALTLMLAHYARRVIAVDLSPRMLMTLRDAAQAAGVGDRVETCEGDLEKLPLPDGQADRVFLSQALHHAAEPQTALNEAARVLRPGGILILLDLLAHDQEWVREQYADQWLGFDPDNISHLLDQAGLRPGPVHRLPGSTPELPVLFCTSEKPTTD